MDFALPSPSRLWSTILEVKLVTLASVSHIAIIGGDDGDDIAMDKWKGDRISWPLWRMKAIYALK